jgi:hypothetical protein
MCLLLRGCRRRGECRFRRPLARGARWWREYGSVVRRLERDLPEFAFLLHLSSAPVAQTARDAHAFRASAPQGFTGTTNVSFNGASASFTVVSDTYLTATVPSGATTGFVNVTTPGGTLKSNRMFLVTPTILSFSPDPRKDKGRAVISVPQLPSAWLFSQVSRMTRIAREQCCGRVSIAAYDTLRSSGSVSRAGSSREKIQHCTKLSRQPLSRDLQSPALRWGFDET